jgi:MFS family permease
VWGGLSDKFGRRRVLLTTCAGTALSYLLWIFSGSFLLLVLARLLGGAMSGNLSVATAAVADVTTRENRAKGMGMVGAVFGLGFVTGPAIGGLSAQIDFLDHWPRAAAWGINPFSVPALVAFLLALVNFVWLRARFVETLPPEKRATAHPVRERNPLRLLFARVEPAARRTNLVYFLTMFAFSGMEFSLTFFAADRFDFGTGRITQMLVFIGLVLIVTQGMIVRRLVPLLGERTMVLCGLLLLAVGFVGLSLAGNVTALYVALALLSLGSGCTTPSLTALASLLASSDRQGQAMGTFRSHGALARVIGPLLAAIVYWTASSAVAYRGGAAVILASLILAFTLPGGSRHPPER